MLGVPKTNNPLKTDSSKKTEDKSLCQSDFPFQQIRFTYKHSGKPRIRSQGKRPVQAYLPSECRMFLRLKLDQNEMHYKIGSVSYQPAGRRLLGLLPAGWH